MRQLTYAGSEITIEETLNAGPNYSRYIASYLSEGFKIYALLTVPQGQKPEGGRRISTICRVTEVAGKQHPDTYPFF